MVRYWFELSLVAEAAIVGPVMVYGGRRLQRVPPLWRVIIASAFGLIHGVLRTPAPLGHPMYSFEESRVLMPIGYAIGYACAMSSTLTSGASVGAGRRVVTAALSFVIGCYVMLWLVALVI